MFTSGKTVIVLPSLVTNPLFDLEFTLTAVLAAGCGGDAPPSVILVSIDTLRADRLGCYGYFRETSPFLDSFAEEAAIFAATDSGTVGTDALADDAVSFAGTTFDAGDQNVANTQLNLAAGKVWAVLLTVRLRLTL